MAAAAVQRRKEPLDRLRENEASPGSQGYAGPSHPDDGQRPRMTPATIAAKVTVKLVTLKHEPAFMEQNPFLH